MNKLGAVICLLCTSCASANAATKLFIIAGQSNASGRADATQLPLELRSQDDVRYWFDTDRDSETQFSSLTPLGGQFGPEIEAGRLLTDRLAEDIVFVKVAFGGTPLAQRSGNDWNVNSRNELYDRLFLNVRIAQLALEGRGEQVDLAGLFWMQGESDASVLSRATEYESNLTDLIARLRIDFLEPELPAFIGQIKIGDGTDFVTSGGSNFPYTPLVKAAQAGVVANDPYAYLVDTSHISLGSDLLHFDAQGQIALGAAFAESYLTTLKVPEPSGFVMLCCFVLGICLSKQLSTVWSLPDTQR